MDADFEVIRRAWAATSRFDADGMRREMHPEVEAVPFGAAMEGKSYRGPDEVIHWLREEVMPSWEVFMVLPEEFKRVGDKILVTGRWNSRGKESGIELNIQATWVVAVRDGKVAYWQTYTDREQALREVGLEA